MWPSFFSQSAFFCMVEFTGILFCHFDSTVGHICRIAFQFYVTEKPQNALHFLSIKIIKKITNLQTNVKRNPTSTYLQSFKWTFLLRKKIKELKKKKKKRRKVLRRLNPDSLQHVEDDDETTASLASTDSPLYHMLLCASAF